MLILAASLIVLAGWAAFGALAAVCRPRPRPLLEARPEYAARHRAVQIGGSHA